MFVKFINSNSFFKKIWTYAVLIAIFLSFIVEPMNVVFNLQFYWIFASIVTLIYGLDILFKFFLYYKKDMVVIRDKKKIAIHYLKGRFVFDFIATIPFALIFCNVEKTGILILFVVLRLIKFIQWPVLINKVESNMNINPGIFRLFKFLIIVTVIVNFISLGWVSIGAPLGIEREGLSQSETYLRAVYWCLTTISTVGYGDISPTKSNNLEVLYTVFALILGVGVYGYIIGNISNVISNMDKAKVLYQKKKEDLTTFFKQKKIPSDLQEKIRDYYEYLWVAHNSIDELSVLQDLPSTLKMEVSLFINRNIIEQVPFFSSQNEFFIREIISKLDRMSFLPEDHIVRFGEFGDCMYFISSGQVDVLGPNKEHYATLGEGSFFGEMSLIKGEKRNANIVALDYCDVYRLSKGSFDELRERYPDFDKQVRKTTEERSIKKN